MEKLKPLEAHGQIVKRLREKFDVQLYATTLTSNPTMLELDASFDVKRMSVRIALNENLDKDIETLIDRVRNKLSNLR